MTPYGRILVKFVYALLRQKSLCVCIEPCDILRVSPSVSMQPTESDVSRILHEEIFVIPTFKIFLL